MARYTGPVCRLCRRAGEKLFLKGERCLTPSCAIERRRPTPGARPQRRRLSDRGIQLREKQKAKAIYSTLERQFHRYYERALETPRATGLTLMQLLERRLDNIAYRLDFAESRRQARQLVRHGHITVDGRKVTVPSFLAKPGQTIGWVESSKNDQFVKTLAGQIPRKSVPAWLNLDPAALAGKVLRLPEAGDIETNIEPRMIVEYYSK